VLPFLGLKVKGVNHAGHSRPLKTPMLTSHPIFGRNRLNLGVFLRQYHAGPDHGAGPVSTLLAGRPHRFVDGLHRFGREVLPETSSGGPAKRLIQRIGDIHG
jgi:hypothetical protein